MMAWWLLRTSELIFIIILMTQVRNLSSQDLSNSVRDVQLGGSCFSARGCSHLKHAHCRNGQCTCLPYYVRLNDTTCVRTTLLGFECTIDEQCTTRVPNSYCKQGKCVCQPEFIAFRRNACLSGSGLGEYCVKNEQCQRMNRMSHCKLNFRKGYGHCVCQPGLYSYSNKSCGPSLDIECTDDRDCWSQVPHSRCKMQNGGHFTSICMCDVGYTVSTDGKRCILTRKGLPESPVSLGKRCESSLECQARDPYSHCVDNICRCISNSSHCSERNTGCHKDTFQCRNGQCISWYFVCNGRKNCEDGSDEDECVPHHCPKVAYQCKDGTCIPRSKVCNGRRDCPDGSDEHKCQQSCDSKAFRCRDGACLPQYAFCNAVVSCRDGTDEDPASCMRGHRCPRNQFRCANGRCRSTAILCSGKNGCGDNSDEKRCQVCFCERL